MIIECATVLTFFVITTTSLTPVNSTQDLRKINNHQNFIFEQAPWHVSIRINGAHFCSGAIISTDWVVTSAQCIIPCDQMKLMVTVQTGSSNLNTGSVHKIHSYFKHELYKMGDCNLPINDIGLLQIVDNFNFDGPNAPKLIQISNFSAILPDKYPITFHWKEEFFNDDIYVDLKMYRLLLLNDQQCLGYYYSMKSVDYGQFCAIYDENDVWNPCVIGDLGSPVVLNELLIGVKTWKMNCAVQPHSPTLFTKVGMYSAWIKSKGVSF